MIQIKKFRNGNFIIKKLLHINIINLYTIIETKNQIYIIQEYASGKELFNYIIKKKNYQKKNL